MPKTRASELRNPTIPQPERGSGYVMVDPAHVVPRRFLATLHHVGGELRKHQELQRDRLSVDNVVGFGGVQVELYIEVQLGGVPRCLEFTVRPQPPEMQPITATSARVPIDRLMRTALAAAVMELPPEGSEYLMDPGKEHRERVHAGHSQRPPHEAVAAVYREAASISGRKSATEAVAITFGKPRSTAARWVRDARDAGVLGPAKRGTSSA